VELDVGIFHDDGKQGVEIEPLFAGEPLTAYLPIGHPLATKAVLGPDDLTHERLIGLSDEIATRLHDLGYRWASLHEPTGLEPRDLMLAVAEGRGVLIASRSMAESTGATAVVVRRPMDPPLVMPDVVVAWRIDPPAHLRPILSTVREVARELREAPAVESGDAVE
jgi:DNA-binding transcriptional LysR family regulator